ncbi:MAG: ATP-dependent 6-phosphofructokinase [Polyangiaceae bacterium]|nr:ATP-dependent 6-phosphofructokinase [Polyangiaceae bacterium]
MLQTSPTPAQLQVRDLGPRRFPSPLGLGVPGAVPSGRYTPDDARVVADAEVAGEGATAGAASFEKAGPRERIFFDPAATRVALVTCGGLCPGLNDVIRSAVLQLHHRYGVREVLGFRYGFAGLDPASGHAPVRLGPDEVRHLHERGGTALGSSRGPVDVRVMADTLERLDIQALLTIGGDGTQRGAHALVEELTRRGRHTVVVGVPKTIDNDLLWTDRTFGFDTAVEVARSAIVAAHAEATSAENGVGLVKLMGRDSGFIAAAAARASLETNFCLVPEVPIDLEGEGGLLDALEARLGARGHALVVVAEGCSWMFADAMGARDASGNVRYASGALDVGARLRDAITAHFKARGAPLTLKYIDPSYMIRGVPANPSDRLFCDALARAAVHAAMAGKTDLVVGRWCGMFTHVPIPVATDGRKQIDPEGTLWLSVVEATGQPALRRR